ncbi:CbtA family protein [Defluviimonas sp. WL0002]|uniref:CbtA family protein n=1 Tax=Albidovulum marisflavi TaxID=2984159 RepID=A0ABT2Z9I9_9RHOB|nr:CbtA family protein [Defluviimonas sp. WL0002]MCV2867737.1 CbtA family protein [Defluviimonas sp. WL0002]
MIQRLFVGGLVAGFAAGLFSALLHFAFIQELILLGEKYETGALVHFETAGNAPAAEGHSDDNGDDGHSQDHVDGAAGEQGGDSALTRNALTVLFTGLIYAGYGLMLVAGFALAEQLGRKIDTREGVLWGVAGFVALQLAPAMGLAPELPGSVGADITQRQIWWLGTVVATGGGLALLAYGRSVAAAVAAGVLLAAPHVIGAPHLDEYFGSAPAELGAEFASRALGVGLASWAALGWLCARAWNSGRV